MGVQLHDLVEINASSLDELRSNIFAVDAYNNIYQFLSSIRQPDGTPLMDFKGKVTSHLTGLFYRNINLLKKDIRPIYVFDGKPPELKSQTVAERKERKEHATEEWKKAREAGDLEKAKRYAQATSKLTGEMVEESKKLLGLMGIPCIQAPSEGEAQAAYIVQQGGAYAVASQDFDSLLFGAPILCRNLNVSGRKKVPGKDRYVSVEPELIHLEKSLENQGISREQLILIGMLSGTDFNKGIKGIGPKKALKIVSEHQDIGKVLAYASEELDYEFPEDAEAVYNFFLNPEVKKDYEIEFQIPDREKIIEFLCEEHDFSKDRVGKSADTLSEKMGERGQQSKLGQWF